MRQLALQLTTGEGLFPTQVQGVTIDRTDRGVSNARTSCDPSIYFLVSGQGVGYVGGKKAVYPPAHYVIFATPTPFEFSLYSDENDPALGISIQFDVGTLAEFAQLMVLQENYTWTDPFETNRSALVGAEMSEAIVRLLSCLQSTIAARVLGPNIVREITYRALNGPHGSMLLALMKRNQHLAKIHAALHWIHRHYAEPFDVSSVAREMCMSVSAFQHSFKDVTGSSPLQYVKSVRLHKARMLVRHHGLSAVVIAAMVGYESASQFSREFRRLFGHNFREDRLHSTDDSGEILNPTMESIRPDSGD